MNDQNTDKRYGFPEAKFTPVKPFTKEEEDRIIKKVHDELIAEGYTMVNGKFVAPKERAAVQEVERPNQREKIIYFQLANGYIIKIDNELGKSYILNTETNEWNQEDIYFISYEHGNLIGKRITIEDHFPIGPSWEYKSGRVL